MPTLPRRVCCVTILSGLIAFTASMAEAGGFSPNTTTRSSNQSGNQSINAVSVRDTNAGYGSGGHAAPPASSGGLGYGSGSRPHHFDPNKQFDGIGSSSATTTLSGRPK